MTILVSRSLAPVASTQNTTVYNTGLRAQDPGGVCEADVDDLILVCDFVDNSAFTDATYPRIVPQSHSNTPFERVGGGFFDASKHGAWVFRARYALPDPGYGGLMPWFQCEPDPGTGCCRFWLRASGVDHTNPVRQFAFEQRTGADPFLTWPLGAPLAANAVVAGFGMPRNPPGASPPAGWTLEGDIGHQSPAAGGVVAYRSSGETGTGVQFVAASGAYGIVAIELNALP